MARPGLIRGGAGEQVGLADSVNRVHVEVATA